VAATMVAFFSIPAMADMPVEVKGLKIGYNGYGD
jgi:hypothetical protein